jgi:hypothetical protein
VRREGGVLLAQVILSAGGTIHIRRLGRAPDQLFKFGVAILTLVFVDRHSYSNLYFISPSVSAGFGNLVMESFEPGVDLVLARSAYEVASGKMGKLWSVMILALIWSIDDS